MTECECVNAIVQNEAFIVKCGFRGTGPIQEDRADPSSGRRGVRPILEEESDTGGEVVEQK